ncbi:endolytic transglycosylase MltG [Actinosynnema sp. NPDC047251]|uniref:Endolytic murein transglycosylase n=1 Tax=Saccharothrix espanaensis (strain ATCC 51144 / DSM 44229 / JCM 9112 / NBRC 15066 / NRRL 15764) TaxID=1179773 RepID=K0K9Y0_SACES|nr:endolytic transglycosylase MltG [Saccharothrix espanaensis]CCH33584.1 Aminodeoxychorismate lyase [Saccharothrix espanaensis DSM 44229]
MSDDLGLFSEQDVHHDERPRGAKAAARSKRRRKKTILWVVVALILVVGGGGAYYGYQVLSGIGSYEDFPGAGEADVVVEVKDGDLVSAIANTLKEQGVVASARAFIEAGKENTGLTAIQPGFYLMKTKMSGQTAVDRMTDPKAKVVPLEVKGGNVLHDITSPDGKSVTKGILSMLADASCAELDGVKKCVTAQELRDAADNADAAALGIPDWAQVDFARAPKENRLEGLITRGLYHLKPGASAPELIKSVIETSNARLQGYGIPAGTKNTGFRPYEVLTIASLIEKEGLEKDFGKISRVIYKRLSVDQELQFDSTVNYKLDRPIVTTSDEDRDRSGPYNTYKNKGLTPTPIGSPSREAIAAAISPEQGPWQYFVKCQKDGTSCFSDNLDEHNRLADKAREEGVF